MQNNNFLILIVAQYIEFVPKRINLFFFWHLSLDVVHNIKDSFVPLGKVQLIKVSCFFDTFVLKQYVQTGAANDDILIHTHSCLLLQLQAVLMSIQCRDELPVVEVLPEGEFAVLKPAKPVKLRGNPQLNEQLFASFLTCADKQNWQKLSTWLVSVCFQQFLGMIYWLDGKNFQITYTLSFGFDL